MIRDDFNFPEIDWDSETCGGEEGNRGNRFLSTIHQNYLFQHVHDFTHFKPNTKPSLLDLIFTNQPEFVNSVKFYAPVGCSHHRVLNFHIQIETPECKYNGPTKYLLNKGDYDGMRSYVSKVDWDKVISPLKSVDECMNSLEDILNEAKHKFIPEAKPRKPFNKNKRNFSSPDTLLSKLDLKRKAFKLFKKYPTDLNYSKYVE